MECSEPKLFSMEKSIIAKGLSRLRRIVAPSRLVAGVSQRLGNPDVFRGWYMLESTTENT